MKINKLNISEFGCIENKELNFGDGISIIKGNNESGKSTTHQAMLALMFGFMNSGRKNSFKLSPKAKSFSGGYPRLDGECTDMSGGYSAARYFEGNAPKLSVNKSGIITRSDNVELDVFNGMHRETYQGIYSLDIDQIVKLKESWDREQDSILAGLQSDILLPNDKIMADLDKKIKEAWKGKTATKLTKAKALDVEISKLKIELQTAMENQNELRRTESNQEDNENKIAECRKKIEKLTKEEIELKRQNEFFSEYKQIRDIMIKNSDVQKYEQVPKDIISHLKELATSAKQEKNEADQVEKKILNLKETVSRHKSQGEKTAIYKELVPKAEGIFSKLSGLRVRTDRDSDREKEKQSKILSKVKRLFTNSFKWNDFNDIMKVNVADCFAILESIMEKVTKKAMVQEEAFENMRKKDRGMFKSLDKVDIILLAAAVLGLGIVLVPFGISRIITVIIGAVIIAAAVFVFWKREKPMDDLEMQYTQEIERLDAEIEGLNRKLRNKLDFSFIPRERLNRIDEAFVESIAGLQDDYSEYLDIKKEVEDDRAESDKMECEITDIAQRLSGQSFDSRADVADMRKRLDELSKMENDAKSAQDQIEILNEQLLQKKNRIAYFDKQAEELNNILFDLDGENIMQKAGTLKNMRRDYYSAESRFNVQRQKYDDYDTLEKTIGKNIDQKIFEITTKIHKTGEVLEDIRNEEKQLNERKGELSERREHLYENGLSPALIEGRLAELKEERERSIRLRDEYALVYGIIQKSRDKFLSERSPQFLKTAGEYLGLITDGKYTELALSDKGTSILVKDKSRKEYDFEAIDETLSRGTKEQVYFALRLAMLNRFDPNGDKLPIVLDEALVNWDVIRFTHLMKIINDISKDRQVFMFTCHDYMVDIVRNVNDNFALINI